MRAQAVSGAWSLSTLAVTTAGLMVEAAFATVSLWLWGMTHADPDPDPDDDSAIGIVFGLPLFLAAITVLCLLIALVLVMPALWLAQRAGMRFGGDTTLCWIPTAALTESAVAVTTVALGLGLAHGSVANLSVYLWWWLAISATILPAGLLAQTSIRRANKGRPVRPVRTVLAGGCLGVTAFTLTVATIVLGVEALSG